jgi:hypothetical protein
MVPQEYRLTGLSLMNQSSVSLQLLNSRHFEIYLNRKASATRELVKIVGTIWKVLQIVQWFLNPGTNPRAILQIQCNAFTAIKIAAV